MEEGCELTVECAVGCWAWWLRLLLLLLLRLLLLLLLLLLLRSLLLDLVWLFYSA